MAAVDLLLFMDDMLHITSTLAGTWTASSTASGYAVDNAREADLVKAWKPSDGAADGTLEFDPTTDSDVGTSGNQCYMAVAYDARGSHQDLIKLQAFNGAWVTISTITTDKTGVWCNYGSFAMPATPYQKYRVAQLVADRSGGAGTITAKIFSFAMFNTALNDMIRLGTDFSSDTEANYRVSQVYRVGYGTTAGAHRVANEYAKPGQRFGVSFGPASRSLWDRITADLHRIGGTKRSIYIQKTGLYNPSQGSLYMCRLTSNEWTADLPYLDQYGMSLEFETCPWL